jgi:lysophospholipase L1-like esterase
LFVDYGCDGSNVEIFKVNETDTNAKTASIGGNIPVTLAKIAAGQQVKIVCWGDSVTAGGDATNGNSYPNVFSRMLKEKFPHSDITVSVVAVGGSGSVNWLDPEKYPFHGKSDICRWEKVAAEKPDLVTLEFVNDAWMINEAMVYKTYSEILRRVKALGAELILIAPHFTMPMMMGFKSVKERESRPYVIALRKFAQDNRLGVADVSARWEHLADEGIPYVIYLKNSINHPNDRGHVLFAEELMKTFADVKNEP